MLVPNFIPQNYNKIENANANLSTVKLATVTLGRAYNTGRRSL